MTLDELYSEYIESNPSWASDATMKTLLASHAKSNKRDATALKALGNTNFDYDGIIDESDQSLSRASRRNKGNKKTPSLPFIKDNSIDISLESAVAALQSASMSMGTLSSRFGEYLSGQNNFASNLALPVKIMGYVFAIITPAISYMAGSFAIRLDQTRKMIETSILSDDISSYDKLFKNSAAAGLKPDAFMTALSSIKGTLVNLGESSIKTAQQFALLPVRLADKELSMFGFTNEQMANHLGGQIELMYIQGDLENLKHGSSDKVASKFAKTAVVATYLAGGMGVQREELIAGMVETKKDATYIHALNKSKDYIISTFGQVQYDNIKNFKEMTIPYIKGMTPMMGEHIDDMFNKYLYNIQHNKDPAMAMSAEFAMLNNTLGADVAEEVIAMMKATVHDSEYGINQQLKATTGLISTVAKAPALLEGNSELLAAHNDTVAEASAAEIQAKKLAAELNKATTVEERAEIVKKYTKALDTKNQSDKIILSMKEKMTLSFNNSASAARRFVTTFDYFATILSKIVPGFDYKNLATLKREKKIQQDQLALMKKLEHSSKFLAEYQQQDIKDNPKTHMGQEAFQQSLGGTPEELNRAILEHNAAKREEQLDQESIRGTASPHILDRPQETFDTPHGMKPVNDTDVKPLPEFIQTILPSVTPTFIPKSVSNTDDIHQEYQLSFIELDNKIKKEMDILNAVTADTIGIFDNIVSTVDMHTLQENAIGG